MCPESGETPKFCSPPRSPEASDAIRSIALSDSGGYG